MAQDEKVLEELYELLTLYFEIRTRGGIVKIIEKNSKIEPALDYILLKEEIKSRIKHLIL